MFPILLLPLSLLVGDEVPPRAAAMPPPAVLFHSTLHGYLPRGLTSFGAAELDGWLYVLGGYDGPPHVYSSAGQHGALFALSTCDPRDVRALTGVEPLQSVALVAHDGGLVRVGGMRADNAAGEPARLRSVSDVARFDPTTGTWSDLAELPSPRSSHDAVVVAGRIVVVGGWTLGEGVRTFCDDALVLEDSTWRAIPAPFRARALAAAPLERDGHAFVVTIGGLGEDGQPTRAVHVLDVERGTWRAAPDFPGDPFGVAAVRAGDAVLASGRDGGVWQLDGDVWRAVGSLVQGRQFHRLVADANARVFALGGIAGMDKGDRLRSIELLQLGSAEAARVTSLEVPLPGAPRNRQGAFLVGRALHLFGGNGSRGQHDFDPETFKQDGMVLDLGSLAAEALAPFPARRQAMEAVALETRGVALVGGGFGHDGEVARSCAETFVYDLEFDTWQPGPRLDRPRSQFSMLRTGGDIWVLGGHDYDPRRVDDEAFLFPMAVLMADEKDLDAGFEDSGLRLPRGRRAFACAELDGRIHLVGGMGPGFNVVDVVDVLDTRLGQWTTIPSPATQRVGAALVAHGGRMYLVGGTSLAEHDRAKPVRSVEVYDPARGDWRVHIEDIGVDLRHVRAASYGERVLVWTTEGEGHGALQAYFVTPAAN
jgi:hypothetical protein